jgi:hypothetical protein
MKMLEEAKCGLDRASIFMCEKVVIFCVLLGLFIESNQQNTLCSCGQNYFIWHMASYTFFALETKLDFKGTSKITDKNYLKSNPLPYNHFLI